MTGTLSATGQIQAPYGSFTTQAIQVGDSSYGLYIDSGIFHFKNANGGTFNFRNAGNTGNTVSIDSTGLGVTGQFSASYAGNNYLTVNGSAAGNEAGIQLQRAGSYKWYIANNSSDQLYFYTAGTTIATISTTGLAVTGALSVASTLSTTPAASANAVQGSGGSFVTVVALPTGWGTVHVAVAENGTTNIGYYQVDFVNGTGIAIQAKTGTTAGATTGQLTFQLSGSNLQARGANATAPSTVKYWIVTGTF